MGARYVVILATGDSTYVVDTEARTASDAGPYTEALPVLLDMTWASIDFYISSPSGLTPVTRQFARALLTQTEAALADAGQDMARERAATLDCLHLGPRVPA